MNAGKLIACCVALLILSWVVPTRAGVPQRINYQGRVAVGGTNFDGSGKFKFALVDGGAQVVPETRQATATAVVVDGGIRTIAVLDGGAGYINAPSVEIRDKEGFGAAAVAIVADGVVKEINVTESGAGYSDGTEILIGPPDAAPYMDYISFWSHDGSSVGGGQPTTALSLPVTKGLYSVLLGETPMMNAIPPGVFTNADVRLRVWFNDGAHGFQQLAPDQRLAAVGYAMMAAAMPDNAITGSMITNGAIGSTHLAPGAVQSAHIAGGAIGASHVAAGSIGNTHLAADAVQAANIAAGAVGVLHIAPGAVGTAAIAEGAVDSGAIAAGAVNYWQLAGSPGSTGQVAVANPSPATGDQLGSSLAQIGADRLWVGAPHKTAGSVTNAGAVCIFSGSGTLLRTVTNAASTSGDAFGYAMAAAGGDRVAIGVPYSDPGAVANAGGVCLFNTAGVFIATIPNPAPQADDNFGLALASLQNGFAVGAAYDNPAGAENAGSVYLYTSGGTLSATIPNPASANYDFFGYTVSGVGGDLVLIGTHCNDPAGVTDSGSVYLFYTNGTQLMVIHNPEPEINDWFGQGIADLGNGVFAVGAPGDNAAGADSGTVYLFDTNGAMIARIENPEPGASDFFGISIASAGPEFFVVGACYDDGSATDSGRAYLFNRSGRLASIIQNPSAGAGDYFASGMAPFGFVGVAIGAPGADQGAADTGRAHIFSIGRLGEPAVTTWNLAEGAVGSEHLASNLSVSGTLTAGRFAGGDVLASSLEIGSGHTLSGYGTTIAGGRSNAATVVYAVVGGGYQNSASGGGAFGVIGGGHQNVVSGYASFIGAGGANRAAGNYSTVAGGLGNAADADWSSIGGGWLNDTTSEFATIGGGRENFTFGAAATIAGGWGNTADGDYATVGGGYQNRALGTAATVAGGEGNVASNSWATVGGGTGNRAQGGYAVVGGGGGNSAPGEYAVIDGGVANIADAESATVGGGTNNHAHSICATVSGGALSDAVALGATVGGGVSHWAAGTYSTIGGGYNNVAQNEGATVPGGANNYANGINSFAAGFGCQAQGNYSFAVGHSAYASHNNSFVWSDGWTGGSGSGTNNEFAVTARNGMVFWNKVDRWVNFCRGYSGGTINTSTGGYLSDGGNWVDNSDRATKTNFAPVSCQAVLEGVASLPITTWNYIAEDPAVRHLGPVAQEFHAAFGLGRDDSHIGALDSAGVALAAIQGLYNAVKERDARISELQERLEALENRLEAVNRRAAP